MDRADAKAYLSAGFICRSTRVWREYPGQGSGIHWDVDENARRFVQGDLRLCLLRPRNFDSAERNRNLEDFWNKRGTLSERQNNLFFPGGIRGEIHRPERFVVRDEMCLSKGLSHVVFSRRRASRRDCVHSAVGLAIRKKRLVLVIAARRFDGIFNADYSCSSDAYGIPVHSRLRSQKLKCSVKIAGPPLLSCFIRIGIDR